MKSYILTGAAILGMTMSSALALAQTSSTTPPKPMATTSTPATNPQPRAMQNQPQANQAEMSGQQSEMKAEQKNGATPGQEMNAANSNRGMNQATAQQTRRIALSRNGVKQVQRKLAQKGLYRGKVDGISGRETRQALMQYQKKNHLRRTGTMDRQTARAMGIGGAAEQSANLPGGHHRHQQRHY